MMDHIQIWLDSTSGIPWRDKELLPDLESGTLPTIMRQTVYNATKISKETDVYTLANVVP